MTDGHPLSEYLRRRDFSRTSEPSGDGEGAEPDASSHHFDFRIQVGDVLMSWALPKGPSTDPSEKRLAVPTEDHPLEYAEFEGVIPEEEYGHATLWLHGEKIQGGYALIRTDSGDDERWLLVKMDDDEADARWNPTRTEPASVLSGRTLDEVRAEERPEEDAG